MARARHPRARRDGRGARVRAPAPLPGPALRGDRGLGHPHRLQRRGEPPGPRLRPRRPRGDPGRGVCPPTQGPHQAGGADRCALPAPRAPRRRAGPRAPAHPDLLSGRRRALSHRGHARGARSGHRRGDRGLPSVPAQGPRPPRRQSPLAPADVRVPAPRGGQGPAAALRHRARPPPARVHGIARLSARGRRQVRGGGRPLRRAPGGRALHGHRPARPRRRRDRHRG